MYLKEFRLICEVVVLFTETIGVQRACCLPLTRYCNSVKRKEKYQVEKLAKTLK